MQRTSLELMNAPLKQAVPPETGCSGYEGKPLVGQRRYEVVHGETAPPASSDACDQEG